jgi:hypothetical protein
LSVEISTGAGGGATCVSVGVTVVFSFLSLPLQEENPSTEANKKPLTRSFNACCFIIIFFNFFNTSNVCGEVPIAMVIFVPLEKATVWGI